MEYAFRHQQESGGFENALGADPVEAVGADAFFLQSFARARLLIEAREAQPLVERLDALVPQQRRAMEWLARNREELVRQDRHAPNRLLFDALAFSLNGDLLEDTHLQEIGASFLERALSAQREDGVFLEHGGHDSSYQAVCMLNLTALWLHEPDATRRERIFESLAAAARWEMGRIENTGEVRVEGNTRTGLGQEVFFGKPKDVNYAEVALALYLWSEIASEPQAAALADRVVDYLARGAGK